MDILSDKKTIQSVYLLTLSLPVLYQNVRFYRVKSFHFVNIKE